MLKYTYSDEVNIAICYNSSKLRAGDRCTQGKQINRFQPLELFVTRPLVQNLMSILKMLELRSPTLMHRVIFLSRVWENTASLPFLIIWDNMLFEYAVRSPTPAP